MSPEEPGPNGESSNASLPVPEHYRPAPQRPSCKRRSVAPRAERTRSAACKLVATPLEDPYLHDQGQPATRCEEHSARLCRVKLPSPRRGCTQVATAGHLQSGAGGGVAVKLLAPSETPNAVNDR